MATSISARDDDLLRARAQRRVLSVLVAAQALSGAGLAAGVTVGALLAQDMLGSTSLAGVPSALGTTGSAVAAAVVGRISQARGRRPGLVTGYLAGAGGSIGVVVAGVADNPVLLFSALFLYGAGTSTNLQARYAGADLAEPEQRGRAVATVLVATTLGGVAGPSLTAPTGALAHAFGIPYLTGPFLLAAAAYAGAAVVLARWLRPDPLLLARVSEAGRPGAPPDDAGSRSRAVPARDHGPGVVAGSAVMVLAQFVMVALMTMTPVHLREHGHDTAVSGLVIAVHIAAMYLPSPLTGRLVDRYGAYALACASGLTMLAAGSVAAAAPGDSAVLSMAALGLLGLGWNFGLVAGTAMIADAMPAETRAGTQGLADVAIAVAAAAGGMASGLIVGAVGYPALALGGAVLALAIVPVATGAVRGGRVVFRRTCGSGLR